jgi:hypothetical protein
MVAQVQRVGSAALAKPAFLIHDLGSYIPIDGQTGSHPQVLINDVTGEVDSDPKSVWQMSRNATNSARLEFRRGGAGVPCDDGRGWCERTAHRRPRSDKGFETAHGKGTNL